VPGSSVVIEYRYADADPAKLAQLAADVARSRVDVIVARGTAVIEAVRNATSTIPIVMSSTNDPVNEGFVTNLSRPGGQITGIALMLFEVDGKRLELLKEALPSITRVAVLTNPNNDGGQYQERMRALDASARSLNIQLMRFEVRRRDELARTLAAIGDARVEGLLIRSDPQIIEPSRSEIAAVTLQQRLPAVYAWRSFPEAGGLMSYGSSFSGFHHRSATYVSRILKGAKPGDLAIEQPTIFELVVNLKTAKALGIHLPKALLFRASEVIQ